MDPLLAAVIAKLPAANTEWPQDAQLAWLRMMAMAMGTVYGGDAVGQMGKPAAPVRLPSGDCRITCSPTSPNWWLSGQMGKPAAPVPSLKRQPSAIHPFVIDKQGHVRRVTGERVVAKEVNGPIFDERGAAGDMRSIIWADESSGLNGADDLTIVA